jgi:hypothetical protein
MIVPVPLPPEIPVVYQGVAKYFSGKIVNLEDLSDLAEKYFFTE